MKTLNLTSSDLKNCVHAIIRQMNKDNFKPDYIVGITRGGLTPAKMISHYLNIPMYTLDVSLRDSSMGPETNCWMAEDAFGYLTEEVQRLLKSRWDPTQRKKILIVDDINDSGATFNWIKKDWQSSCLPKEKSVWEAIWNHTTRFAVVINNEHSEFQDVSYSGMTINKFEDPHLWVTFPWENWWEN